MRWRICAIWDHSRDFWALCEELCPDTKRCKTWLKRNGGKLQAIVFLGRVNGSQGPARSGFPEGRWDSCWPAMFPQTVS